MASSDEDDLEALRLAALASMKSKPKPVEEDPSPIQSVAHVFERQPPQQNVAYEEVPFPMVFFDRGRGRGRGRGRMQRGRGGRGRGYNQFPFTPANQNLIVIPTMPMQGEEPVKKETKDQSKSSFFLRPQDKWAGTGSTSAAPVVQSKPKDTSKFRRYDDDTDSEDDDYEEEDSESNGEGEVDETHFSDKELQEVESPPAPSDHEDSLLRDSGDEVMKDDSLSDLNSSKILYQSDSEPQRNSMVESPERSTVATVDDEMKPTVIVEPVVEKQELTEDHREDVPDISVKALAVSPVRQVQEEAMDSFTSDKPENITEVKTLFTEPDSYSNSSNSKFDRYNRQRKDSEVESDHSPSRTKVQSESDSDGELVVGRYRRKPRSSSSSSESSVPPSPARSRSRESSGGSGSRSSSSASSSRSSSPTSVRQVSPARSHSPSPHRTKSPSPSRTPQSSQTSHGKHGHRQSRSPPVKHGVSPPRKRPLANNDKSHSISPVRDRTSKVSVNEGKAIKPNHSRHSAAPSANKNDVRYETSAKDKLAPKNSLHSKVGKDTERTSSADSHVLEARRKKFESASAVGEAKKTISLKGIVPKSKKSRHAHKDFSGDEGESVEKLPHRKNPLKSESKPASTSSEKKQSSKISSDKKRNSTGSRSKRRSREESSSSSSSESSSSKSVSSMSDSESESETDTWRNKKAGANERQVDDIERERRKRQAIERQKRRQEQRSERKEDSKSRRQASVKDRGVSKGDVVPSGYETGRPNLVYKQNKRFYEIEDDSDNDSPPRNKSSLISVVRNQVSIGDSTRDVIRQIPKGYSDASVPVSQGSAKQRLIIHLEKSDEEDIPTARHQSRKKSKKRRKKEVSSEEEYEGRETSPVVSVTFDSGQKQKKPSVYDRLGVRVTSKVKDRMGSGKMNFIPGEDLVEEDSTLQSAGKRKKLNHKGHYRSSEQPDEGLSQRILQIQARNAKILRRKQEVEADKERYG